MRNRILDMAMQDRKLAVVNILLEGDRERIDLLVLKRQGDQVKAAKVHENLESIEAAVKKAGKRIAFHLHFNGKGVLQKEAAWRESYRASLVLNSSVDDLVFSDLIQDEKVFASIIRKEVVTPFLEAVKSKGALVTAVTSGEAAGAIAAGFLLRDKTHSGTKILELHNGVLRRMSPSEESLAPLVDIEGDTIPARLVPAHSAGVDHLMGLGTLHEGGLDLDADRAEQAQKNLFHVAAGAMAAIFLVLLVGNFLWLGKLQDGVAQADVELGGANVRLSDLQEMKRELEAKEALLGTSGMKRNDRIPMLLDDIGAAVPSGLRLIEVDVHPLSRKMEEGTPPQVDFSKIKVSGICEDTEVLNQWMENLRSAEWLASSEITAHAINRDGEYEFTVEIGIK